MAEAVQDPEHPRALKHRPARRRREELRLPPACSG